MREQPGKQLPIAADPAVFAFRKRAVSGRVIFHQLDIDEAGARVLAFDQIVAEDGVLRKALADGGVKGAAHRRCLCR